VRGACVVDVYLDEMIARLQLQFLDAEVVRPLLQNALQRTELGLLVA